MADEGGEEAQPGHQTVRPALGVGRVARSLRFGGQGGEERVLQPDSHGKLYALVAAWREAGARAGHRLHWAVERA